MKPLAAILLVALLGAATAACEAGPQETPATVPTTDVVEATRSPEMAGDTPKPVLEATATVRPTAPTETPAPAATSVAPATPVPTPTITIPEPHPHLLESEYNALVALYIATNGPAWKNNENWLNSRIIIGEWHGVLAYQRKVIEINLSNNGLTGELPPELGDFSGLKRLDLSGNELTGEIPPGLGNVATLENLDLSGNELTGEIPAGLGNLAALQSLDLSDNRLTGEIPAGLDKVASLGLLDLEGNDLTGSLPQGDISGLKPPPLSDEAEWRALVAFYLATGGPSWQRNDNWLSDQPIREWLGVRTEGLKVTGLRLPNNGLTGDLPPELADLTDLDVLDLSRNQLTGELPPELTGLTNLVVLDLSRNQLTGELPPEVAALINLVDLDLSENQLTGELPPEVAELFLLDNLYLGGTNRFSGCVPAIVRYYRLEGRTDLAGLKYCSHELTETERLQAERLRFLRDIGGRYFPYRATALAGLPLISDGITEDERSSLRYLVGIDSREEFDAKLHVIRSYADTPLFDFGLDFIRLPIDKLELLTGQGWFQDGIDDLDLFRIEVIRNLALGSTLKRHVDSSSDIDPEDLAREFIVADDPVRTDSFTSPLGKEIELLVISRPSVGPMDDAFERMRTAIEATEDFLGIPWRTNSVKAIIEPEFGNQGFLAGDAIIMMIGGEIGSSRFRPIVLHEMGHHYANNLPKWMNEGGAEFLRYYAVHFSEGPDSRTSSFQRIFDDLQVKIHSTYGVCQGGETPEINRTRVQDWLDDPTPVFLVGDRCVYELGASFLLGMYLGLGQEVVWSALLDLWVENRIEGSLIPIENVTEEDIYQAFLSNTPPEKREEFRDLYSRLHGGPIPDSQ